MRITKWLEKCCCHVATWCLFLIAASMMLTFGAVILAMCYEFWTVIVPDYLGSKF